VRLRPAANDGKLTHDYGGVTFVNRAGLC